MNKSRLRFINIILTTIMVLNSIVTPQMAYASADGETEERFETNEDGTQVIDAKVTDEDSEKDNENSGAAEVHNIDNTKATDTAEDEEVADETREDINNGSPLEREEVDSEKEHTDEVDSAEEATYEKEAKDDAPEPQIMLNQAQNLGNIFDFDYFQLDGESVEDPHEINFDGTYQIQYHWETDANIQPGDTASLKLPDVFLEWADAPTQNITVGPENIVVGTYTINNGVLEFVFDEGIAGKSVQEGFVGFNLKFNREAFTEEFEQEVDFDGDGVKVLTVIATPTEIITEMMKSGTTDSPINAREITWSIDIVNGSGEVITNGSLEDIIPDGLGEPEDFIVRELSYDLDGNETVGGPIDFTTPGLTGDGFTMSFDSIAARSGYRVKYTTPIENYNPE